MSAPAILYFTAPDIPTAENLALALIEARLAACVNIDPGVRSIYRWQGAVERADEVALIVKTRADLAALAAAKLKELHPYETPAISELAMGSATDPDFIAWLVAETRH